MHKSTALFGITWIFYDTRSSMLLTIWDERIVTGTRPTHFHYWGQAQVRVITVIAAGHWAEHTASSQYTICDWLLRRDRISDDLNSEHGNRVRDPNVWHWVKPPTVEWRGNNAMQSTVPSATTSVVASRVAFRQQSLSALIWRGVVKATLGWKTPRCKL